MGLGARLLDGDFGFVDTTTGHGFTAKRRHAAPFLFGDAQVGLGIGTSTLDSVTSGAPALTSSPSLAWRRTTSASTRGVISVVP